jgi:16S rRNA G527 N7-methylase RsmG
MVAECLLPLEQLGDRTFERYLDIGAGGGLPLVPLMIAGVASHATAAERTQKKARILGSICKSLELAATILPETIEDLSFEHRFELVSLRYVKLTEPLLRTISNLLAPGGVLVYYSAVPLKLNNFEIAEFSFESGLNTPPKFFSIISSKA